VDGGQDSMNKWDGGQEVESEAGDEWWAGAG